MVEYRSPYIYVTKSSSCCQPDVLSYTCVSTCARFAYWPAGSIHMHSSQYVFFNFPPFAVLAQQSPPSYSQSSLLFPSSQLPSPLYPGCSHPDGSSRLSGSMHLHSVQYFFNTLPFLTLLAQQSP